MAAFDHPESGSVESRLGAPVRVGGVDNTHFLFRLSVLVMALAMAGCHGAMPRASEPGVQAAAAGPAIDAAALSVHGADRLSYSNPERMGSTDNVFTVVRGRPAGAAAGETFIVQRFRGDGSGGGEPMRESKLVILDDGSIGLAEEINRIEKVEVVFDPPLIVMPQGLSAAEGAGRVQQLRMTVHPLGDRSRVRASGPVTNTLRNMGRASVQTPAGAFESSLLVSEFTADLAPARVVNRSEQWLVPKVGMVAEVETERTTVLGVQTRLNRDHLALTAYEAAERPSK